MKLKSISYAASKKIAFGIILGQIQGDVQSLHSVVVSTKVPTHYGMPYPSSQTSHALALDLELRLACLWGL